MKRTTRPRRRRTLTASLALALVAPLQLAVGGPAHADDHGEGGDDGPRLELVLDSSGSMSEAARGGQTKIEAARKALHSVVDGLDDDDQVGMRVYGATVYSKRDPGACTDSQQVVDIGPADKGRLDAEIDRYKPYGETPISYSLRQAARDLGKDGRRSIILVSDGQETCDADPCAVAREVAGTGIDLTIDVVGLSVSRRAQQQLQCIADAGGGVYYDADDADDLEGALGKLSTRAFREFEVGGAPVEGSDSPAGATEIDPGRYATTIDAKSGAPGYFAVRKTPGSSLWVSVTARPPHTAAGTQELDVVLGDASGDCETTGRNWGRDVEFRPVLVAETMVDAHRPDTAACAAADEVLVGIAGHGPTGPAGGWEAELTIVEEPAVADTASLPDADGSLVPPADSRWRGDDDAEAVIGGTGFTDAPTLDEGAYADTIVPGERLLYRVPAEFGQRVVADVYFPKTDPVTTRELPRTPGGDAVLGVLSQFFGPGHGSLTRTGDKVGARQGVQGVRGTATRLSTPEIRYNNRTAPEAYRASVSGDYYIEVDAAADDGQAYTVPFQLRIRVVGEPSGAPDDADAHNLSSSLTTTTGTASTAAEDARAADPADDADHDGSARPSSQEDSAGVDPMVWAGGAALVALLVAGTVLVRRVLRRPGSPS